MLATARLRLQSLHRHRKILSSPGFHFFSPLEKEKPVTIQNLIDNIENQKTKQNLDDIVKQVQGQNVKEQKRKDFVKRQIQQKKGIVQKQREIMAKFEKKSDKKGKDFWFQKSEKGKGKLEDPEIDASHVTNVESPVQEDLYEKEVMCNDTVKIENLKKRILEDNSDREVSKLMTAMIDSVDQDADDIEENFQNLIKAFNINENNRPWSNKNTRGQESRRQRKGATTKPDKRKSLRTRFDNPTSLFANISSKMETVPPTSFFESRWREDLHSLLPEVTPKNAFEVKMLDIDREWRYPIDNEQDMGIEESTSFDEHVFLDYLLEEFPENGPVYKFMELVITGLQQNPYLSVEEKANQVLWFKDYFDKFSEEDLKIANLEF